MAYFVIPEDKTGKFGSDSRHTNKRDAIAEAKLVCREGWPVAWVFTGDDEPRTDLDPIFAAAADGGLPPDDADFGDGSLSPGAELRKAALNRGRP